MQKLKQRLLQLPSTQHCKQRYNSRTAARRAGIEGSSCASYAYHRDADATGSVKMLLRGASSARISRIDIGFQKRSVLHCGSRAHAITPANRAAERRARAQGPCAKPRLGVGLVTDVEQTAPERSEGCCDLRSRLSPITDIYVYIYICIY